MKLQYKLCIGLLSIALSACDDKPKQRDVYTSKEDCLKEWEFDNLCEHTSTMSGTSMNHYWLGPFYNPGNRGVEHVEYDDDDNAHHSFFYPAYAYHALTSPIVDNNSPSYLRPSGTNSVGFRPASVPRTAVNSSNIVRGGFGSAGRAMSFGG